MKIAVVGCGALGSYYGAKLCRAGRTVHFLLRSDYETVRRRGVHVISPEGNFHVNPKCARNPEDIGICDLVLIGLKTTANAAFPNLLPPLVGPQTAILTLQNGLGSEAELARLFGEEKILGGLCFVCLNRVAPGRIEHSAHGRIVMGEYRRWPEPRTHDIASMFRHAGIPCDVAASLEQAHWDKLAWNIPFNGLGVASAAGLEAMLSTDGPVVRRQDCLTTDRLLGDPAWENLVRELIREIMAAAKALGWPIDEDTERVQISRTREMGPYKASTVVDFEQGRSLELETLFLEPLRQAEAAGIVMPRLSALCRVLRILDGSSQ